jgi:hydroxypyruvate isomerase
MEFGLCIEMVFAKDPFEMRVERAARAGFKNVEMWFVDGSFKGRPDELAKIAEDNDVLITNTVIGSPDGSVGGALTNPRDLDKWLERARMSIDFTVEAGIPSTIVCTGNEIPGLSDDQMEASVLEGLEPTVEMAEGAGITLLLETLNTRHDHAGYWLTSSDRGAEICRKMDSKRMKMLFDCYHMQIMEGDLVNHIENNIDVIGHFHCAGVPGRHEPYIGEVNYPFVLQRLADLDYDGIFGLEYRPTIEDAQSVAATLNHLSAGGPD